MGTYTGRKVVFTRTYTHTHKLAVGLCLCDCRQANGCVSSRSVSGGKRSWPWSESVVRGSASNSEHSRFCFHSVSFQRCTAGYCVNVCVLLWGTCACVFVCACVCLCVLAVINFAPGWACLTFVLSCNSWRCQNRKKQGDWHKRSAGSRRARSRMLLHCLELAMPVVCISARATHCR